MSTAPLFPDVETDLLIAAEKQHLWHPFTQMKAWCAPEHDPLVLVEALARSSGTAMVANISTETPPIWTNIHGHCHPAINAAIKSQLR